MPRQKEKYKDQLRSFLDGLAESYDVPKNEIKSLRDYLCIGNVVRMPKMELFLQHVLCHKFYPFIKNGRETSISVSEILNFHASIVSELCKRGVPHANFDKLDGDTESFINDKNT